MDKTQVTVIERRGMGMRAALETLQRHDREHAILVDQDQRFEGVLSADRLVDALNTGEQRPFEDAFVEIEPVAPDAGLDRLIGLCADTTVPLPVVDEHGTYCGTVSRTRLLRTLDRAGGSSQPQEAAHG